MAESVQNSGSDSLLDSKALAVSKAVVTRKAMGSASRQYGSFHKERALELLADHPNHLGNLCKALGITRQTWYWHLDRDRDFAIRVQEIREACCDALETTMYELGVKPTSFNFNDRIAYLRAHRPQLYDRAKVVKIEGYKMGTTEKSQRIGALENVIDAEITKSYLSRKEQRERKAQKQLQQRRGGGDGSTTGGQGA